METKRVCKDKAMALSVIQAIEMHTESKAQKAALQSVAEFIERAVFDISADSDERNKLIDEIIRNLALCVTDEDRKRMIALYCGNAAEKMKNGGLQLFVISKEEAEALK